MTEASDILKKIGVTNEIVKVMEFEKSDDETGLDIKKLVLAWDADYTKLTPAERARLERAEQERETVSHEKINWD